MQQLNLDNEKQFLQTQKINENTPHAASEPGSAAEGKANLEYEVKIQMDGHGVGGVMQKNNFKSHPVKHQPSVDQGPKPPLASKATTDEVVVDIDPVKGKKRKPKGSIHLGRWEVYNRDKERRSSSFYFLLTGAFLLGGTAVASSKSAAAQNSALVLRNSTGSGLVGSQDGEGSIASFDSPSGVAADSDGNIYVSDTGNNEIRKINVTGYVSTLAGNATAPAAFKDGVGADALFNAPIGITSDPATGILYVVDSNNSLIRQVDPKTQLVTTVAGSITLETGSSDGQSIDASFSNPYGIACDSKQNLYISDTGNNLVRQINSSRYVSTFAGISTLSRRVSSALSTPLKSPLGIAVDYEGSIFVVDSGNFQILKFNPTAGSIRAVLNLTSLSKAAITVDKNNSLWVSQADSNTLQVVPVIGDVQTVSAPSSALTFLTFTPNGDVVSSIATLNIISVFVVVVVSSESPTTSSSLTIAGSTLTSSTESSLLTSATSSTADELVQSPITPTLSSLQSSASSTSTVLSSESKYSSATMGVVTSSQSALKLASSAQSSSSALSSLSSSISVTITSIPRSSVGAATSTQIPTTSANPASNIVISSSSATSFSSLLATSALSSPSVALSSSATPLFGSTAATVMPSSLPTTSVPLSSVALSAIITQTLEATEMTASSSPLIGLSTIPYAFGTSVTSSTVATTLSSSNVAPSSFVTQALSSIGAEVPSSVATTTVSSSNVELSSVATQALTTTGAEVTSFVATTTLPLSSVVFSSTFTEALSSTGAEIPTSSVAPTTVALMISSPGVSSFLATTSFSVPDDILTTSTTLFPETTATSYVPTSRSSLSWPSSIAPAQILFSTSTSSSWPTATRAQSVASLLFWITSIQAGAVTAGNLFSTQPVLLLTDQYGDAISSASISLSLFTDSGCSASAGSVGLSGNTASTNSSGYATFTAFNATTAGTYYVKAFYNGLNSSCSTQALSVTAASVASLSFTTQPSGSVSAGTSFPAQPVVLALDSFGNAVSSTSVTLSAYLDSSCLSGGSGTVSSGTLSTNVTGYAAYASISYNQPQTIYLKATNGSVSTCSSLNVTILSLTTTTTQSSCTATSQVDSLVTTVSTFAGSGLQSDIDGIGIAAAFIDPEDIAVSSSGMLYVCDRTGSHVIRMIDPSGSVSTLAGTSGNSGYQDGQGSSAVFNSPSSVTVDSSGIIFVADSYQNYIRRITPSGLVSTFAGSGSSGLVDGQGVLASFCDPSGLAVDSSGAIYVGDYCNHAVRKITPSGNATTIGGTGDAGYVDGTDLSLVQFHNPAGVAVDSAGYVYVADNGNSMIRIISPAGVVSTLAGCGSQGYQDGQGTDAQFSDPCGLAVDNCGNVYVADTGNDCIRKITPSGLVSTFAGGSSGYADGLSQYSYFRQPMGVAIDSNGTIWVADRSNYRIRSISFSSQSTPSTATTTSSSTTSCTSTSQITSLATYVSTFAGSGWSGAIDGLGTSAAFKNPQNIAISSSGVVYVTDQENHSIRKIDSTGLVSTLAGSGSSGYQDGQGAAAEFWSPYGIAVDESSDNIFVVDSLRIRKITPSGLVSTVAGNGYCRLVEGQGVLASFCNPSGIAVDSFGTMYVADTGNNRIRKISPSGLVSTFAGTGYTGYLDGPGASTAQFNNPTGVAVDSAGNVYVSEYINRVIRKISPAGYVSTFAGTVGVADFRDGQGTYAYFFEPRQLAVDADDNIYVSDIWNHRIRKITPCGLVSTLAGSGGQGFADGSGQYSYFNGPMGVAVDSNGTVWVADTGNNRIRSISVSQTTSSSSTIATTTTLCTTTSQATSLPSYVSTFAGSGTSADIDDVGTAAAFIYPRGVAASSSGILYVTETDSHIIRMIDPFGSVSTLAGTSGHSGFQNGQGASAYFNRPNSVVVDSFGNIFVSDEYNHLIRGITPAGEVTTFAGADSSGNCLFSDGPTYWAYFCRPSGLAIDASGTMYVSDTGNNRVRKISPAGQVSTLAGSGYSGYRDGPGTSAFFTYLVGIAVDSAGNVYVADYGISTIRKITPEGYVSTLAGSGSSGFQNGQGTSASFDHPCDVVVDSFGTIYVADVFNHWIRKITPCGLVSTVAGSTQGFADGSGLNSQLSEPIGIGLDSNGTIWIADSGNNRIRKFA